MEYAILTNDDPDRLSIEVNLRIEVGWELLGGVSVALSESEDSRYTIFAQAMIRRATVISRERMPAQFAEELRRTMASIDIP